MGHAWLGAFSPLAEFCLGLLLMTLAAWTSKTRREASDDMNELIAVPPENPLPKTEVRQTMTLQEAKKLPEIETGSPGKPRPRHGNPRNPA